MTQTEAIQHELPAWDDSATLEQQLAELLGELTVVQEELLEVLASKRDRIAENDLDGVRGLQPRAETLCRRLHSCHDRRAELLDSTRSDANPSHTLAELAASLPDAQSRQLRRQVVDVSARARLLQHHGLTNWVLAQRSVLHLSQMLEILATGGRLQPTYGDNSASLPGGLLVDQQA